MDPASSTSVYWGGRTRTSNFLINSQAVCQLTYTPSKQKTRQVRLGGPLHVTKLSDALPGRPSVRVAVSIIEIIRDGESHA
jgi:hypothetical protein